MKVLKKVSCSQHYRKRRVAELLGDLERPAVA